MAGQNLSIPYQDIDDRLRNIGTPADSPSESGSLHAKVKALQDEPSLHDLWLKAGATYQKETNTYTLNGLAGLTKDEMLDCWLSTFGWWSWIESKGHCGKSCKTNFPRPIYLDSFYNTYNFAQWFNNSSIQVINLNPLNDVSDVYKPIFVNSLAFAFQQAKNLEYVYGIIDVSRVTVNNESFGAGANKLTNIYLRGLKNSIDLHFLPALTVKDSTDSSLGYMVENAANTEPITITLHPDAFIRLEESLIQKAQKKQISIASA